MLRWNLMLGTLFGSRRQQPQARRTQTTKKLSLESLEARTMPSASPANPLAATFVASPPSLSTVAAAASYAASTMDQLSHLIETVQQEAIGIVQTLDQRIAQEMAAVSLQLAHFFGINLTASSQSTALQPSSGPDSNAMPTTHGNKPISEASKVHPLIGSGPEVDFETPYTQVAENSGTCDNVNEILMVSLSAPSSQTVTVTYSTQDGTAYAGIDYTGAQNQTVTFAPGQTVQTITIPILDDGTDEQGSGESFNVALTGANGATVGSTNVCQVAMMENNQQQATDTLQWNPCPDDGNNASTVTNWYDVTQGFQLPAGSLGPNPSSPIQFDANLNDNPNSNAPIIWDKTVTVASISMTQYTGKETINPGITVESKGTNGSSLSMDGSSNLYLYFGNGGAIYKLDNNAGITNMKLTGFPNGLLNVAGGTTTIAQSSSYNETVGVNIQISIGATLDDQSYTSLLYTNDGVQILDAGTMKVFYGSNASNTLINNGGNADDFINVLGGTLSYFGSGGVTDTIQLPVQVSQGGTFRVSVSASAPQNNGKLIVQGVVPGQAIKASVLMSDAASSVQLAFGDTLECDSDYYQANGTLETTDATTCTLQDGAQGGGTATIAGGGLIIDSLNRTGYATFNVNCSTLNFAGTYYTAINAKAQGAGSCDLLNVTGATNLQGASLYVYVNNPPPNGGSRWIIIQDGQGKLIQNNFNMPITTDPQTNLNPGLNQDDKTQYLLSF